MVPSPLNTTPPSDHTGHLPLLDQSALDGLLASLDHDEDAVDGFVATFVGNWPDRLHRTAASLAASDRAALYDCALSIKVSSQMIGAARLSGCAGELESLIRSDRLETASVLLQTLRSVGDQTLAALSAARSRTENAA